MAEMKVCAKCQFKNSAQKNYCDRCGTELNRAAPPPKAPGAPDAVIPQTAVVRKGNPNPPVPQPESGFSLPQAGRSVPAFAAPPTKPSAPAPTGKTGGKQSMGPSTLERAKDAMSVGMASLSYVLKSALAVLFMLALAFGAFLLFLQHRKINSPEFAVKASAETYLEMQRGGDYANAYMMLTEAARAMVTLDEFRLARDTRDWKWSNVRVTSLEPASALAVYDLAVAGNSPEPDYLFFELVGKRWLRPYNWTLLQKAETALRANDPDMALLRAQAAVNINPRDPLARAYICEANYFRRLLADADRECRMALELAAKYPSKIEPRALRHVRTLLADASRVLGKSADAGALYEALLADPQISVQERCEALRGRGALRESLGQAAAAKADLDSAARQCPNPQ